MRLQVAFLVPLLVAAVGCRDTTTQPSTTTTSTGQTSDAPSGKEVASQDRALVRFMNADPAGKPRELWIDNVRLFGDVEFRSITPYLQVPAKAVKAIVRERNGVDELASSRLEFFAGKHYTFVASPRKDGSSILLEIGDDLSTPKAGKAKVRVINASTDADDLDLFVAGTKNKVRQGVDPSGKTSFAEVDPGALEIRSAQRPAPPRLSRLEVASGGFYTFIVVGDRTRLEVIKVEDQIAPDLAAR
jgi:hypothetical protein